MLFPKKIKYKKQFKKKIKGNTSKGQKILFGIFGLKSLEFTRLTSRQIESARKIISRKIKRLGKLWIRVYPDIPVTSKSTGNRMGKGKGSFDRWVFKVKPGQILFEISGISEEIAFKALDSAVKKLPIKMKKIIR